MKTKRQAKMLELIKKMTLKHRKNCRIIWSARAIR